MRSACCILALIWSAPQTNAIPFAERSTLLTSQECSCREVHCNFVTDDRSVKERFCRATLELLARLFFSGMGSTFSTHLLRQGGSPCWLK